MENEAISTVEENAQSEAQEPKTYTEDEVRELLQKEGDKRVTEALKKAERKKQAAIKEATKLAQMNDEEKYHYELEQREKEIEEKEKALALAENKATASGILAERGLSTLLVDLVLAEDAEEMLERITRLDDAFKSSVKSEVEKRLASKTPKKNLPLDGQITKESFRAMPLSKQAQLYQTNPDLYKQLTN